VVLREQGVQKLMVSCGLWNTNVAGPSIFICMVNGKNYL